MIARYGFCYCEFQFWIMIYFIAGLYTKRCYGKPCYKGFRPDHQRAPWNSIIYETFNNRNECSKRARFREIWVWWVLDRYPTLQQTDNPTPHTHPPPPPHTHPHHTPTRPPPPNPNPTPTPPNPLCLVLLNTNSSVFPRFLCLMSRKQIVSQWEKTLHM